MTFGDIIGLIVVFGGFVAIAAVIASAYKRRLAHIERKLEITSGEGSERAVLSAKNIELENRVRVLERIVTQSNESDEIARQIDALLESADGQSEKTLMVANEVSSR